MAHGSFFNQQAMATQNEKNIYMVGIAGGSGSGKSYVTNRLRDHFPYATAIELDHYYHCQSHLAPEDRIFVNYDEPQSIDYQLLNHHLELLKAGRCIERPNYCFASHCRLDRRTKICPSPLIIVEGILSLYWEELRQKYNLAVFIDCSEELRFERRASRDRVERGRTIESIKQQWEQSVIPMHLRYVEDSRQYADEIILSSETEKLAACIEVAGINLRQH